MLRYHYAVPTCSLAGMIALEATGTPYAPVLVDMADRAGLRAINPGGKVPVLEADGLVLTDTIAIITWLARRYPEAALLPTDPDGEAMALSMMAWLGSVVHILRRQVRVPVMFGLGEAAQAEMKAAAEPRYRAELERIDGWIGEGKVRTAGVQGYALLFYHWALIDGVQAERLRHFTALAREMTARPDVVRALERHASPLPRLAA